MFKYEEKNIKKRRKNKKGFTLVEMLVVISIIGLLSVLGVRTYSKIMEESAEKLLYSQIVNLEGLLEANGITNIYLGYDDNEWKKFQKNYYGKKDLFNIPNKLNNRKIYYKEKTIDGENVFCVGFEVKTDLMLDKAKNDDGAINNYIELCSEGKTNIDLSDDNERYIVKNNYF